MHHAPPASPSHGVAGQPYWVVVHASGEVNAQEALQPHSPEGGAGGGEGGGGEGGGLMMPS